MSRPREGPMSTPREAQTPGADTSRPHPARIYDYALGGKSHISQEVRADFCNRDRT